MREPGKNSDRRSGAAVECAAGEQAVVDPRIVRFIGRHRVMTLATVGAGLSQAGGAQAAGEAEEGEVWCCNLFYAYMAPGGDFPGGAFVFTSPADTRHAAFMVANPRVAGSIVLESKVVGRLQGLQFCGSVCRADSSPELLEEAKRGYLKRFPFAAPMLSDLWVLSLSRLKYTDNTLGFGTKLIWNQ